MTDYHIKIQELQELREAIQLKRISEELLEHLMSSLRWLLHYAQKNNIDLPDRDKIIISLERVMEIVDKIPDTPTKNQQHFTTPDESTESKIASIAE